jgi:benzoate 4-monooxygenase
MRTNPYIYSTSCPSHGSISFVSLQRGVFNTRSRSEHTRKRKIVSHVFSQKNVLEFEPNVRSALLLLTKQWDQMVERGLEGHSGQEGESTWTSHDGRVWYDCLPCEHNSRIERSSAADSRGF